MRTPPLLLALLAFACLSVGVTAAAEPKKDVPEELGHVKWERDFKLAAERAKQVDRPLLVQFQEVPG